jgi:RNA polymerase sigma-70 factor (ECF subfamily)
LDLVVKSTVASWNRVLEPEISREVETRFADMVNRQSRFLFRLVYAVLRNADDAEDVVQETFLKLFKNESWLNIQDERAFLARTAWRVAIGRKRAYLPACTERHENSTPEAAAIERQRTRQIHTLIQALPEKLREPLVLSALRDLTTTEIAMTLDEPEGTVRRRISEARALLKRKLERMDCHAR